MIVQPYESALWHTTKRLRNCEVWSLPAETDGSFRSYIWWMPLFRRDVTLWPMDAWSGIYFGTFLENFRGVWSDLERSTFDTLRIAWGHPFAEELGEPAAIIETLWRRNADAESKAA